MTTIVFIEINTPITDLHLLKRKDEKGLRIVAVGLHLQKTIDVNDIKSPVDVVPAHENIRKDKGKFLWKKNRKSQK
jgi:hypothetical protein